MLITNLAFLHFLNENLLLMFTKIPTPLYQISSLYLLAVSQSTMDNKAHCDLIIIIEQEAVIVRNSYTNVSMVL